MNTLTIPLELTDEQNDALTARVAKYNSESPTALTPAQYLDQIIIAQALTGMVNEAFNAAVTRLGAGAAALSYEARKELIAAVEAKITPPQGS